jgi:hypothetical protein
VSAYVLVCTGRHSPYVLMPNGKPGDFDQIEHAQRFASAPAAREFAVAHGAQGLYEPVEVAWRTCKLSGERQLAFATDSDEETPAEVHLNDPAWLCIYGAACPVCAERRGLQESNPTT